VTDLIGASAQWSVGSRATPGLTWRRVTRKPWIFSPELQTLRASLKEAELGLTKSQNPVPSLGLLSGTYSPVDGHPLLPAWGEGAMDARARRFARLQKLPPTSGSRTRDIDTHIHETPGGMEGGVSAQGDDLGSR